MCHSSCLFKITLHQIVYNHFHIQSPASSHRNGIFWTPFHSDCVSYSSSSLIVIEWFPPPLNCRYLFICLILFAPLWKKLLHHILLWDKVITFYDWSLMSSMVLHMALFETAIRCFQLWWLINSLTSIASLLRLNYHKRLTFFR